MTFPVWGWVGAHRFGSFRHHDYRFRDSQECSSAWSSHSGVMAAKSALSPFLCCLSTLLLTISAVFQGRASTKAHSSAVFLIDMRCHAMPCNAMRWRDMQFSFWVAYSNYSTAQQLSCASHAGSMMMVRQTPKRLRRSHFKGLSLMQLWVWLN